MISHPKHYRAALALVALTLFTGCQSRQDQAIDQAKKQAASTGQPQQVISTGKNGNTITITVQPPVPGQNGQVVTTTVTPPNTQANGQPNQPGQPQQMASNGQPAPNPAPPPNSAPIIRPADINIPAGTDLAIRINQHISVKTSRPGDRFTGEIAEGVPGPNNQIVIPRGTHVEGIIDASHRRGHFKGASILQLRLIALYLNGTRYPIDTHDMTRTKRGKGKRSAAFIGGGAGLGMLVGGVATGGVGLLVGGLAGGGAGTALGGLTGNRDIEIPAESLIRFRLADDLTLQP